MGAEHPGFYSGALSSKITLQTFVMPFLLFNFVFLEKTLEKCVLFNAVREAM
jgi:hypothetical protein